MIIAHPQLSLLHVQIFLVWNPIWTSIPSILTLSESQILNVSAKRWCITGPCNTLIKFHTLCFIECPFPEFSWFISFYASSKPLTPFFDLTLTMNAMCTEREPFSSSLSPPGVSPAQVPASHTLFLTWVLNLSVGTTLCSLHLSMCTWWPGFSCTPSGLGRALVATSITLGFWQQLVSCTHDLRLHVTTHSSSLWAHQHVRFIQKRWDMVIHHFLENRSNYLFGFVFWYFWGLAQCPAPAGMLSG